MRKTKRCIAQFTFYDRTGIQAFLEKQAENGWMLEKISPLGWKFRRTEPQKVHYAVTYFPKASVFDTELTEGQRTMQEFCAYAGWELVDANGPLQIFRNEAENPLPIETDPVTELQAIHASAKKSFLPSYFMLLIVALMNIALQISQLWTAPLSYLPQNNTLFNWVCQLCLLTMCCQEIFGYFLWRRKARKAAVETGTFVETKGHRYAQLTLLSIVIIAFGWLLLSMESHMASMMGTAMLGIFSVYAAVFGLQFLMKRKKVSREVNRAVTLGAAIVLPIIMTVVLVNYTVQNVMTDKDREREAAEAYQVNGFTFYTYDHELPLYVEDLMETDYEHYSTKVYERSSVLLTVREYFQEARVGEYAPEIHYEVYDVHLPLLYGICREELLNEYADWSSEDIYGNVYHDEYRAVDASPWGAGNAYRRYSHDQPYDCYLLCYEDRLIKVQFNWEVTAAQMAAVGQTLNN